MSISTMIGYYIFTLLFLAMAFRGSKNITAYSKMSFKSGDCKFNTDTISNFSLQIINSKVSIDFFLVRALQIGVKAHLKFDFRLAKENPYHTAFQHDLNFCNVMKTAHESIYGRWLLNMIKFGNFSTSCPVPKGYYYLHNWTLDGNLVPTFFQVGDYRIGATMFYGKYRKTKLQSLLECTVEAVLD